MPYSTPITRTYIDTRHLALPPTPNTSSNPTPTTPLPLLTTLPLETQTSITRFLRPADRLMSLSSALLKHHFIHITAKLPWSTITISRTPAPHARPYWSPPPSWTSPSPSFNGLEFNVTHQAGITCLIGCPTPTPTTDDAPNLSPLDITTLSSPPSQAGFSPSDPPPRLGLDIACTNEPGRTRAPSTPADLTAWIDVFAEMFSARERSELKSTPVSTPISSTLRRFYTAWALKEAFIKLIGEGLLAPWLRSVEFLSVRAPSPMSGSTTWTPPAHAIRDITLLVHGTRLYADDLAMSVVAFESDFIVAEATRGVLETGDEKSSTKGRWVQLDIEQDIRPCAEGRCRCLD